jgi:5-methyltetrahydropteroyltriglutamate--homocysteine methyltransferase
MVFSSLVRGGGYKGYRDPSLYLDTAAALREIAVALVDEGAEWIQIDEPFLSVGAPMDIARNAVEHVAADLGVPVAMHVCGVVEPIFPQLLQWSGITLLSHAFKGDKNDRVLASEELRGSDKMLGLGCIDTKTPAVDAEDDVVGLLRRGIEALSEARVVAHPDCGMRLLPREAAFEKMKVMVAAAHEASAA